MGSWVVVGVGRGWGVRPHPGEDGTHVEVGDLVDLQVHRSLTQTMAGLGSHPWVFPLAGVWVGG